MKKENIWSYKSKVKRRDFKGRARRRKQLVKFKEENRKIRQNEAILSP